MVAPKEFGSWSARAAGSGYIDPAEARDLIIECFEESQHETYARIKEKLGVIEHHRREIGAILDRVRD